MDDTTLRKNLDNHFQAIDLCVGHRLNMPTLILTYSAIDFLAWLGRPEEKPDVDKRTFVAWAHQYIVAPGFSQCEAADLYSARCAHLHSNAYESKMTRSGEAAAVLYAWGAAKPQNMLTALRKLGREKVKVVHLDELVAAIKKGAQQFLADAVLDEHRWSLILTRSAMFFDENPELDRHIDMFAASNTQS